MIPTAVVAAFFVGLIAETLFVIWADRLAIRREQSAWEELRAQALDHYERVFDWERDL